MDAPAPVIVVDRVSVRYAGTAASGASPYGPATAPSVPVGPPALDDVSFRAAPGTLTLLCGASGSGKSTALRLLNGLVPTFHRATVDGRVEVAGLDVPGAELAEAGARTGTVFQDPRAQFFTTEVLSELAFGGENRGQDPEELLARCRTAARETGIGPLLGRSLRQLSGGELQKVACTQAVVGEAEVLLLDEPTSNLSGPAIEEFIRTLAHLKSSGRTLVVAEHRLHVLRDLADQVLVFSGGQVAARLDGQEFFALDPARIRALGLRTTHRPAPILTAARPATGAPAGLDPGDSRVDADAATAAGAKKAAAEPILHGLSLRDLRFSYGRRRVLDLPALDLPAGQVHALTGPNGAGKSTLARLLCGLASPARGGRILRDGVTTSARHRRGAVDLVMQDVHRQLFSGSVREEVLLGIPAAQRDGIDTARLLARLDLEELAPRHPLSLSGGQKQRLVIAAAIARRAPVHVFDEPTSGVDRRHLESIAALLRELAERGDVVLVITHDPELVELCADTLVTLHPLEDGGRPQHVTVEHLDPARPDAAGTPALTRSPA